MPEIKVEDCKKLREEYMEFCNRQEQHAFPMLAAINVRIDVTIKALEEDANALPQKELRAMFRTILKIMGKDYSEYNEVC